MNRLIMSCSIIAATFFLCCPSYSQIDWVKNSSNPVLPFWRGNENDPLVLHHAMEPCVLYDAASGIHRMWFSSSALGCYGYTYNSMSMGLSPDGTTWFVYDKNPVLQPGDPTAFDEDGILSGSVIHNGTEYLMYYSGQNASHIDIGLATSPDGFTWMKYSGNPVVTRGPVGSWDSLFAAFPQVIYDGGVYYMWYGGYNGRHSQTGFAISTDGINWTKYGGNPVLVPGDPGSWEDLGASVAGIVKKDTLYYMLYRGNNQHEGRVYLGLATSSDRVHWVKYGGNPVVNPGSPGQWDAYQLSGATLLFHNNKFHLWYCASGGSSFWETGYATSDFVSSLGRTMQQEEIPTEYKLYQSYPNPLNPEAVIKYDVPMAVHVTIKIYDALGQETAILVDDQRSAGQYSVVWNAQNASSGVYWCQMNAGDHLEVQKMMLVK